MSMVINKTDKPMINMPEVLEDTSRRVQIFIWENKYKEAKRKETDLE